MKRESEEKSVYRYMIQYLEINKYLAQEFLASQRYSNLVFETRKSQYMESC